MTASLKSKIESSNFRTGQAVQIDKKIRISQSDNPQLQLTAVNPWDEAQWQKTMFALCNDISLLLPEQRNDWLIALREFLVTTPILQNTTLQQAIQLSSLLCDWHLQIECLSRLEPTLAEDVNDQAYAYWKLGDWQTAIELLERQMLLNPENACHYDFYGYLIQLSNQQAFSSYCDLSISAHLRLEPLSHHHSNEFFWQYWDPQIAELCCLPFFENKVQWHSWLTKQHSLIDQSTYAVMHERWGFIGVVSLVSHQNVGFFYFWIGKNFQNKGYGTEAVCLLLQMGAEYFNIDSCYAKVFKNNKKSQKALSKLGFQQLPFVVAVPHENELYYYAGEEKSAKENARELHYLLLDMQSDNDIDVPISWKMAF